MRLNYLEFAMMNNPVRAASQRYYEARKLLRMGGPMDGGFALEIGGGRGVGAEIILDVFGADRVDSFDLDPAMVARAETRLAGRPEARFWVGDASAIDAEDGAYDAVFDFGVVHHIPDWQGAVRELARVLRPGGMLYAEEVLAPGVRISRHFLEHPQENRFSSEDFRERMEASGFEDVRVEKVGSWFAWFVARKGTGGNRIAPEWE